MESWLYWNESRNLRHDILHFGCVAGKVLPKGAMYIERKTSEGKYKRVISCPLFERMNTEGRPRG